MIDQLERIAEQLLGRVDGPFHFRVLMQPIVATVLAIRAGMRDAREGKPAFLWQVLTNPDERRQLIRSMWSDLSQLILMAFLMDSAYQVIMLKYLYPLQALFVVMVLAVIPYVLFRGPTTRVMRWRRKSSEPHDMPAPPGPDTQQKW